MWSPCTWLSQLPGCGFPQMEGRKRTVWAQKDIQLVPYPSQLMGASWSLNVLEKGGDIGSKGQGHQLQSHSPFAFSCQGTCHLQCPGCCPHGSCHLPTTGGHGAAGGRRVPLLLQVSLASLPVLHTQFTPALHPCFTGSSVLTGSRGKVPCNFPELILAPITASQWSQRLTTQLMRLE